MLKNTLGTRKGSPYEWRIAARIIAPAIISLLSLLIFTPPAFAATRGHVSANTQSMTHYLALGNSLSFGFQPDGDFSHGYVNDIFNDLRTDGVQDFLDLGCPGETSSTMIKGGCPFGPPPPYTQLGAALLYLQARAGHVSLVTLDIGSNDLIHDTDPRTCKVNVKQFNADLAALDTNLTGTILPSLHAALMINGHLTGDLVMMNYYDPLQNLCPNTVKFTQKLNQHLATDVQGFGNIVNVFQAFGGSATPNPDICKLTWMCAAPPLGPDIHPTTTGYQVIATTFLNHIEQ